MRPFTYSRAETPAAAVQAAVAGGAATRYLAGGTTLYDLMKLDIETPRHVIDVTGLSELTAIDTGGSSELVFGALARMSDVAADRRLVAEYPVAGGVATAAQHGDRCRKSSSAHPMRLFPRRRTFSLQQTPTR